MTVCDFDAWVDKEPVIAINGNPEFEVWSQNVPVCDVGTTLGGVAPPRRRVSEF